MTYDAERGIVFYSVIHGEKLGAECVSRSRLWRAATPSLKSICSVTSSQLNKDLKACVHREHSPGATHTQRSEVERCVCVAAVNARNAQKICIHWRHTHTTIDNASGRCLAVCVCVCARACACVHVYVSPFPLFSRVSSIPDTSPGRNVASALPSIQ